MDLDKLVEEIQGEIDYQIYDINQGGCGWFAYYMVKHLKSVGIDAKIKIIDDSRSKVQLKKTNINNYINKVTNVEYDELRDTSFIHCFVKVGSKGFDARNSSIKQLKDDYDGYRFAGEYTLQELEIALKVGGWNSRYNKNNNRLLEEIIQTNILIHANRGSNRKITIFNFTGEGYSGLQSR